MTARRLAGLAICVISASTGPRPRGRGMAVRSVRDIDVQFGFNGAAPARARNERRDTGPSTVTLASTGPRPRGRGMCSAPRSTTGVSAEQLQRGRARAGAEWLVMCQTAGALTASFNGAAPARARNVSSRDNAVRTPATRLQRGRARAGAECTSFDAPAKRAAVASTGPRPRGRGMVALAKIHGVPFRASTGPRPRGRGMN